MHPNDGAPQGALGELVDLIADLLVEELLRRGLHDGPKAQEPSESDVSGDAE